MTDTKNTVSDALLPCPFCGATPNINDGFYVEISCLHPVSDGPDGFDDGALEATVRADTREQAARVWNRRASIPGGVGVKGLAWSEATPPTKDVCSYDHCTAETTFGQYRLEWKSWKGNEARKPPFYEPVRTDGSDGVVIYAPGEQYVGCEYSLDEAKAAAQADFERRIRSALYSDAARDVLAERKRQVEKEGWTPEHDDQHETGELARAAGLYALIAGSDATTYRNAVSKYGLNDYASAAMKLWPWDASWWKPSDRRRDLVKAGALILAEIERLDRAAALSVNPQSGSDKP